ncbi:MAG: FAD/NAD(P)-binding protein [Maribacter sp.]
MSEKISFIGAGIATSYTLIPLIEKLLKDTKNVDLYLIDKTDNFYSGIPYGKQSGEAVLLINDLKSFIPSESHRTNFKNWLNENLNELLETFVLKGGELSNIWVSDNKKKIENGEWDDLYVPRFFFGKYIKEQVNNQINKAKSSANITIKEIRNEAIDIQKVKNGFIIDFIDKSTLDCDKVILSAGSLPNKKLFSEKNTITSSLKYINNLYSPSIESNIKEVVNILSERNKKELHSNILVLGANASGLEAIYRIFDQPEFKKGINTFTCLSTHGTMPDGRVNSEKLANFSTVNLNKLQYSNHITADQIAHAVNKDLDLAETLDLGAASTVGVISKGFGSLLPKLNKDELIKFACAHGNQIGRRQRCAGIHYLSVIEQLIEEKKFTQIKGRFENLELKNDYFRLNYVSPENNVSDYKDNFHIVINCLGSINLKNEHIPDIFKNVFNKNLASINDSNIGIKINENLQASENLYIAGPMLAGNLIEDRALWHLEHCGRIIWSSEILANKIYDSL